MYTTNTEINNQLSIWLIVMFCIISFMIIVGGLTRLTDSGLSITEWELFRGFIPPISKSDWENYFSLYKQIPEYKLQNFNMNITEFKIIFWWEWVHRFLGRLIGLTFFIPLIYFAFKKGLKETKSLIFIFLLICFQGFLGWFMVKSGLINRVDVSHFRLSMHLTTAFVILSLILWQILKCKNLSINESHFIKYNLPLIFLLIIFLQIIFGAFVSGMDAGKIYNSWPLMGNSYFPDDNNIINLFKLSAFNDPSLVQFIHRNLAYIIVIFYLFIVYKIYKAKMFGLYKSVNVLGILLIFQIILGIVTVLYGAQIYIASVHQISSIFLVSACIYFYFINTKSNLQPSN